MVADCLLVWNRTGHVVWESRNSRNRVTGKPASSRLLCIDYTMWFEWKWHFVASKIQSPCQCYKRFQPSVTLITWAQTQFLYALLMFLSPSHCLTLLQMHTTMVVTANTTALTLAYLTPKHLRAFIQIRNSERLNPHTWQLKLRSATKVIWT